MHVHIVYAQHTHTPEDATLATTKKWYTPLHYAAYYMPRYQVHGDEEEVGRWIRLKSYLSGSLKMVAYLIEVQRVQVKICHIFDMYNN